MTLDVSSYFDHIKAYLSDEYIVHRDEKGEVELKEKYFREGETRKSTRVVRLSYKGKAFSIKLDGKKEWSKRCDFIVFQCFNQKVMAYFFEFKTKSLDATVDQLKAKAHWCTCLSKVLYQYTGDKKPLKYVLTENNNPGPYLDAENKYLARDPSVRHYHYDDLADMRLDVLENDSIKTV